MYGEILVFHVIILTILKIIIKIIKIFLSIKINRIKMLLLIEN